MAENNNNNFDDFPRSNYTMRDINDYCVKKGIPSLAQGMIELAPPALLRNLTSETINREDIHRYRTRFGEDCYREALSYMINRFYNVNIPKDAIIATAGVTAGIVSVLMMARSEGKNRVGLIEPAYTYHIFQSKMVFGQHPIAVPSKPDFCPDFDKIQEALDAGIDVLITSNPHNPSGRVWRKEELQRLTAMTEKANCRLIVDECYSEMIWKGESYSPVYEKLDDHVIAVRGFSKTLGMQSWRMGYAISSPQTIAKMMAIHDPIYICVSWYQHSLAEYLKDNYDDFRNHVNSVNDLMQSNWAILAPAFEKALGWKPVNPEGSMYGCFYHNSTTDIDAVIASLRCGAGVCPGSMFSVNSNPNTGYVRIHCGVTKEKAQRIANNLLQSIH
eukprot:TRINITY_DN661_c0_g2_i1.p1 TRINITY_DN661_c0_g2~~TRINITY_DN661_c0_g2_i1.p1  ORF type:complete len:388 (-),score=185.92 TRINITY_DN661_c0_g2_i1:119-1282(-)